MIKKPAIWIGFWFAGCILIGLIGGITWGFITLTISIALS